MRPAAQHLRRHTREPFSISKEKHPLRHPDTQFSAPVALPTAPRPDFARSQGAVRLLATTRALHDRRRDTSAAKLRPKDRSLDCRPDRGRSQVRPEGPWESLLGHSQCCEKHPIQNARSAAGASMPAHTCHRATECRSRDSHGGPFLPATHLPHWFFQP